MKYSADDIKVISGKEIFLKRPEMYFGSRGINPESIVSSVSEGAFLLGAKDVRIKNENDWWSIHSDLDWLKVPTELKELNETNVFERIWGFPEAGDNFFRWEALTVYFSDITFTIASGNLKMLLGEEKDIPQSIMESSLSQNGKRSIVFKFNKNA